MVTGQVSATPPPLATMGPATATRLTAMAMAGALSAAASMPPLGAIGAKASRRVSADRCKLGAAAQMSALTPEADIAVQRWGVRALCQTHTRVPIILFDHRPADCRRHGRKTTIAGMGDEPSHDLRAFLNRAESS